MEHGGGIGTKLYTKIICCGALNKQSQLDQLCYFLYFFWLKIFVGRHRCKLTTVTLSGSGGWALLPTPGYCDIYIYLVEDF